MDAAVGRSAVYTGVRGKKDCADGSIHSSAESEGVNERFMSEWMLTSKAQIILSRSLNGTSVRAGWNPVGCTSCSQESM